MLTPGLAVSELPCHSSIASMRDRLVSRKDWSIEVLRGVAILLVVAYHVISGQSFAVPDGRYSIFHHLSSLFDCVRMPLFTVITGYVFALRPVRGSLAAFYRGNILNAYWPRAWMSRILAR